MRAQVDRNGGYTPRTFEGPGRAAKNAGRADGGISRPRYSQSSGGEIKIVFGFREPERYPSHRRDA